MHLTDYPHPVDISHYEQSIKRMVARLAAIPGVHAIYQIGSIGSPGISDIDMFVVFDDHVTTNFQPIAGLSRMDRYLFLHALYGANRSRFNDIQRYTFFHNYSHLWGEDLFKMQRPISSSQSDVLKVQTALEYLYKMYISATIERSYQIIRVHGLLLHIKALMYDLQFLNVSGGRLFELISEMIQWRENWFHRAVPKKSLIFWHREFYNALHDFLVQKFSEKTFYLPQKTPFKIARNVTIDPGPDLSCVHRGLILPPALGGLGRKYFNIQHRWNTFVFTVPSKNSSIPLPIMERNDLLSAIIQHNKRHLPNFMAPASSLSIF